MKKLLSVLLISVMALSLLAGCGSKEGGDKEAKGEVYYLNFKPEADQAWQALAKTYTKETGVKVTVAVWLISLASGTFLTMSISEITNGMFDCPFEIWVIGSPISFSSGLGSAVSFSKSSNNKSYFLESCSMAFELSLFSISATLCNL